LECLTLSESYHFNNLYIYSAARIAQVLLDINMYEKSLKIMETILPEVLTQEDLWLQSLCLLIEAKCLMTKLSDSLSILDYEDESKSINYYLFIIKLAAFCTHFELSFTNSTFTGFINIFL